MKRKWRTPKIFVYFHLHHIQWLPSSLSIRYSLITSKLEQESGERETKAIFLSHPMLHHPHYIWMEGGEPVPMRLSHGLPPLQEYLILPKELLAGSLRTKKQPFSPAWQGFLSPCHQIRETVVLFLHIMCLRFSNHYQKEIKAANISLRLRKWEVCTRTFLNRMYESGYLPPLGKPQNLNRLAQKCIFFTHTNCDVSWEALFSREALFFSMTLLRHPGCFDLWSILLKMWSP